jgi:hypothetical protein
MESANIGQHSFDNFVALLGETGLGRLPAMTSRWVRHWIDRVLERLHRRARRRLLARLHRLTQGGDRIAGHARDEHDRDVEARG